MNVMPEWVPPTFEEAFALLFAECQEVMVERHRSYGAGNINAFGPFGTLVRLSDKLERLKHMAGPDGRGLVGTAGDRTESIDDSLVDASNYCQILRAQLREWWTKDYCPPLEKDK